MAYMLAALDEGGLARMRKTVKREAAQRGPIDVVDRIASEALYPEGHPYRRVFEAEEVVDDIELDAVRWFFQRMYGPSNAALAIVGDVDTSAVQAAVHKYFDSIRGSPRSTSVRRPAAPHALHGARKIRVPPPMGKNFRYERLRVAWATPAHYATGDAALDVAATMLADRLEERLVHDGSVFRGGVGQGSFALSSRFTIALNMVPGYDPEKALAVVDQELSQLQRADSAAFERARRRWVLEILSRFDSLMGRADVLASSALGGSSFSLQDNLERYRTLTAEDVARAVSTYLARDLRVVVHTEFSRFARAPRRLVR
jgi:zinc protease